MEEIFVQVDEFTQGFVVDGLCGLDRCVFQALRRWSSIAIEGCFAEAAVAGPKACTDHFMRIGFAGDGVGTLAGRGWSAGKAGDRQIEASPKEVYRADLAHEAGGKLLEDAVRVHQDSPESMGRLRVVGGMLQVLSEGNRMRELHRYGMDVHAEAERGKTSLILTVEFGNRLGAER